MSGGIAITHLSPAALSGLHRALVCGAVLTLAACAADPRASDLGSYTPGHTALIEATKARRVLEPRLSGFPFMPWTGRTVPPAEFGSGADLRRLRRAVAHIERELSLRRSPDTLGAAAAVWLLQHEPSKALQLLDEALAAAPGDPRLWVDRAATVLQADQGVDRAADIASMADQLNSTPTATAGAAWCFNRALVLERLGLTAEAASAFREAAAAGDEWAEEAARRGIALERATTAPAWEESGRRQLLIALTNGDTAAVATLVNRWPLAASVLVEDELLTEFAAGERSRVEHAKLIARLLARGGDSFLVDTLDVLERVPELARAHLDYTRGRSLQRQGRPEEAQVLLAAAAATFERAGSPFAALAELRWATCGHQRGQYAEARDRIGRALQQVPRRHLDIRARLEWFAGMLEVVRGRPTAALEGYRRALEIYEQSHAQEGIATVEMLTAETWWVLGEWREAWRHRRRALRLLPRVSDAERQRTILDEAAEASAGDGLLRLASTLQDRVVESARGANNDFALSLALAQRGRVRCRRGDRAGALADVTAARGELERLPPNAFREHLEAYLLTIEAEALRETAPEQAVEKLEAAAVYYQRMERWISMRNAVLDRARSHLRYGDEKTALEDLRVATALGERVRTEGGADRVRGALDQQAQPLYAELVRLELERGRIAEAFSYAELSRARRLTDALEVTPTSLSALRAALPEATALLAYYDLGPRLVVFVIRRDAAEAIDLPAADPLTEIGVLQSLSEGAAAGIRWRQQLAALETRLIAPVRPRLVGITNLVIVPHRDLFALPFGALYDDTRKRYLIQDYRLQVAPSATVFTAALARFHTLSGRDGPTLAVAVPVAPRGLAQLLVPLRHATEEARAVAAAYPAAELLAGGAATKARFLERAHDSTIVHFAGHAVASATQPALSFLALNSTTVDAGALYADEIASRPWPMTRLVMLSACRTAQRSQDDAEGIQGLARAFLAAGVPAVVGTLWKVEDRLAGLLATRFHRAHAGGLDPASALRAAQLSMLREAPTAPPAWAAYELIGGVAETTIH